MDVVVTFRLESDAAEALAQMCKRFTYEHAENLSNRFDGGRERDAMLDAIGKLDQALASIGYAPR